MAMSFNNAAPNMGRSGESTTREQRNDAEGEGEEQAFAGGLTRAEALKITRDAYRTSTDYFDSNFRRQIETSLRYFDGKHAADSKYFKDAYKHRSKGFRPKSRSMARKLEAQACAAFFSNPNLVDVQARNQDDPQAYATAQVMQGLLDYRLSTSIPAFMIVMGGLQDAVKTGVVCSYNYWMYKTRTRTRMVDKPLIDESTGQPALDMMGNVMTMPVEEQFEEVVEDKPCVDLVPIEYIRFSPNAKWYDVINTTPYLVRIVPMYLNEIRERMTKPDKYGRTWSEYTDNQIKATMQRESDSTRQTRLGRRQDPVDNSVEPDSYDLVNCMEWIVSRPDGDVTWWTIGTDLLVTDPEWLENVYLHGKRPLTMGFVQIETHKVVPQSLINMGGSIQREINELTNDRRDNVRLVLQKQWFVRAGKNIDTANLMYGVPGGVTHMQDPEKDVIAQEWGDVTASSYNEQDRLNGDYDELTGNFSASSITANRRLNETVGGLELLGEGANSLSEYSMRTFSETWWLPTLRQIILLEQYYESDERVLAVATQRAQEAYKIAATSGRQTLVQKQAQQVQMDEIVERMAREEMIVVPRVGMNATDPGRKLLRFAIAMRHLKEFAATPFPGANLQEIGKEVMSLLGYGDGVRFFDGTQPEQMVMAMAQAQATQMLTQAETAGKAILEAAYERLNKAETAEEQARSAQMTLVKYENTLMERFIAQAMRELKFEKDKEVAAIAAKNAQPAKGNGATRASA